MGRSTFTGVFLVMLQRTIRRPTSVIYAYEKLYINENVDRLLNTRKELVSKCRHMLKYALVKKAAAD